MKQLMKFVFLFVLGIILLGGSNDLMGMFSVAGRSGVAGLWAGARRGGRLLHCVDKSSSEHKVLMGSVVRRGLATKVERKSEKKFNKQLVAGAGGGLVGLYGLKKLFEEREEWSEGEMRLL